MQKAYGKYTGKSKSPFTVNNNDSNNTNEVEVRGKNDVIKVP